MALVYRKRLINDVKFQVGTRFAAKKIENIRITVNYENCTFDNLYLSVHSINVKQFSSMISKYYEDEKVGGGE